MPDCSDKNNWFNCIFSFYHHILAVRHSILRRLAGFWFLVFSLIESLEKS
ncbi:MAG: hypothetical protein OFPI_11600 [Osedax symbiont Rs2]|nr:MAG: hypothetical protein OFPI_11600 [Osedax symbiont Rs2]